MMTIIRYSDNWSPRKERKNEDESMSRTSSSTRKKADNDNSFEDSPTSSREPSIDDVSPADEAIPDLKPSSTITKASLSSTTTASNLNKNSAAQRPTKSYIDPAKKIDLGAAASYKGVQPQASFTSNGANGNSNSTNAAHVETGDLLADLFAEPAAAPVVAMSASATNDDFADFSQFTAAPVGHNQATVEHIQKDDDDEFADFATAFDGPRLPVTSGISQSSPSTYPINLLGDNLSHQHQSHVDSPPTSFTAAFPSQLPFDQQMSPMDMLTPLPASGTLTPSADQHGQIQRINDRFLNNNHGLAMNANNAWSSLAPNVNIDLNNLGRKNETKMKPSMNQLAATVGGLTLSNIPATNAPQRPSPVSPNQPASNYLINQNSNSFGKF